ncbi:hypothetical protein L7F22_017472 [Adiantum nelumboides]|nr:hypothetical protein [Adiantum nelumboides]
MSGSSIEQPREFFQYKCARDYCQKMSAIDWETMIDIEFKGFLGTLHASTEGVTYEMFPNEEAYFAYKKRAHKNLESFCSKLSEEFKEIDLVAALRQSRGRANYEEQEDTSEELPDLPSFEKEKPDQVLRRKRSAAMEEEGRENVVVVPNTDTLFTGPQRSGLLHLPRGSKVAIDTCVLVYIAQQGVDKYREKAEIVFAMLNLPLEFVVAQSVFSELHNVLLKAEKPITGLGESTKRRRRFRHEVIRELFEHLECHGFAAAEGSRGSYLNQLRLTSAYNVQPYDARLVLESAVNGVHVFVSEDMGHGQLLECVRDGVKRSVLVWNVFKQRLKLY